MTLLNPETSGLVSTEPPKAIFSFPYTLESSDPTCVVTGPLVLDLTKCFTITGWFQFVPPNGGKSSGDILLIESPSVASSLYSIWVEFPEQIVHFSCTQESSNTVKTINTGVSVPRGAFHLAIEYGSATFTLYLNGEKCKAISEASPLPNPNDKFIVVGRSECKSFRSFHCTGRLFGIDIYSLSLTEGNIRDIFIGAVNVQLPLSISRPLTVEDRSLEEINRLRNDWRLQTNDRNPAFVASKLVTRNFAHDSGVWRTTDHLRLVADIRKAGKSDIIGFGYSGVFISANDGKGTFGNATMVIDAFSGLLGWEIDKHPRFLADTSGDGYPDIVGFGDQQVVISRNNRNGTFQPTSTAIQNMFCSVLGWNGNKHPRFVVDLTGNGVADIIGFGDAGVHVSLNNGNGTYPTSTQSLNCFGYNDAAGGWRVEKHPRFLADLTGDGRPDIIGFGDSGASVSLNNGYGGFQASKLVTTTFGYVAGGWRVEKHPRYLADLTGDGRADIIGFGDEGVLVAQNDGDGTFRPAQRVVNWFGHSENAGGWRVERHPRFVMDMTGNKCADIIGFYDDGVWIAFNNGDGTFQTPQRVLSEFGYDTGGWRVEKHPRILADMTGGGLPDIVGFGEDGVYVSFNVGNGRFGPLNNLS